MAIPLDKWSLDYVTPSSQCVRRDGECIQDEFSPPPDASLVLPFSGEDEEDLPLPPGILDEDTKLIYVDPTKPLVDITGSVPQPGYYVLVANYFQPGPGE